MNIYGYLWQQVLVTPPRSHDQIPWKTMLLCGTSWKIRIKYLVKCIIIYMYPNLVLSYSVWSYKHTVSGSGCFVVLNKQYCVIQGDLHGSLGGVLYSTPPPHLTIPWGWSGGAKVSCILRHWGVQLILAYSWARPSILVAGKGKGGIFLFLLFLHFHSCFFSVPLFHLFYLFSPFLWEMTQNDPQGLTCR